MKHPHRDRLIEEMATCVERSFAGERISVERRAHIPDVDSGEPREVDVLVEGALGSAQLRVIVECRDHSDRQDVTWIEQLATKRRSVGASHVIAVSTSGFTKPAITKANRENVELRLLVELDPEAQKAHASGVLVSTPKIHHRIDPKVTLILAAMGSEEPKSSLEASIDNVSVFLEPATGGRANLPLLNFLESELRRIHDGPILSGGRYSLSPQEPTRTVAENVTFDFATPAPLEFRVVVGNESFQLVRVLGQRTTMVETVTSAEIGGYEYCRVGEVESGLLGTLIVIGVRFPDGRVWPFIHHRAPAPGKDVLYICGLDLVFDAESSGFQKTTV